MPKELLHEVDVVCHISTSKKRILSRINYLMKNLAILPARILEITL